MATRLRERVDQGSQRPQTPDKQRHLSRPMVWVVAVVLLAVICGVIWVAVSSTGDPGAPEATVPALTNDERICQLATQGSIPLEACSTASHGQQPHQPLYTTTEVEMLRLVEVGSLPKETLDSQTFLIKRLANQGQIPRETAYGLTTP